MCVQMFSFRRKTIFTTITICVCVALLSFKSWFCDVFYVIIDWIFIVDREPLHFFGTMNDSILKYFSCKYIISDINFRHIIFGLYIYISRTLTGSVSSSYLRLSGKKWLSLETLVWNYLIVSTIAGFLDSVL